jgi:hypothetical protein
MAKPLTNDQKRALVQAEQSSSRLTKLQVFALAQAGLIDVEGKSFVVSTKGSRALARENKRARVAQVKGAVSEAALAILDTEGALTKHRAIWEAVGRQEHSRDEVLDAMRELRDEGILASVKLSGNNFQIAWRRGTEAPAVAPPAEFEVNELDEVAAA